MKRPYLCFAGIVCLAAGFLLAGMVPTASAAPRLELGTSFVDFGILPLGKSRVDSLIVFNAGTDPLTITKTIFSSPGTYRITSSSPIQIQPQSSSFITIEWTPLTIGTVLDTLFIVPEGETGDADTLLLRWEAIQAEPFLSLSPDTLLLETGLIGTPRTKSFTITNSGGDTLLVRQILIFSEKNDYRLLGPALPFKLSRDESRNVEIELQAHDTGCTTEMIVVVADIESDTIILQQCTETPFQIPELDTLYQLSFPPTLSGMCEERTLQATHFHTEPIRVFGIYGEPNTPFKNLTAIPRTGLLFTDSMANSFRFEFCPETKGSFRTKFRCVTEQGIFFIETTGATPKSAARIYYLDTINGNVGENIEVRFSVDPPLSNDDLIDSIDITLTYDETSIVLADVRLAENLNTQESGIRRQRLGKGTERIILTSNIMLSGRRLLLLDFVGLSTGKDSNVIGLDGSTNSATDLNFENGQILLEGCTLGASGFYRRIAVESLTINPSGTEAVLRYTSPEGAAAEVAVIDASGREAARFVLDPGSNALQEWRLPLDQFFPGLYGLLIQVADDRVIVPFIAPR